MKKEGGKIRSPTTVSQKTNKKHEPFFIDS
jgi:hypothetical protein